MSIKHWPEGERPREKLLAHGAAALSDAELLAILLRTGIQGMSAVDLARYLLQQFGSLAQFRLHAQGRQGGGFHYRLQLRRICDATLTEVRGYVIQ